MLTSCIYLAAIAGLLSLLLTPAVRRVAVRLGWVDNPDAYRKLHRTPVPRIGGVPVMLSYVASLGVALLVRGELGRAVSEAWVPIASLLPAAAVVFGVGLFDDLVGVTPRTKLLGQCVAAALACMGGIQIRGVAYHAIDPSIGIPLTIVWLIGCTNAFNLIDGVDGLATGVGLVVTLTIVAVGALHNDAGLLIAVVPLAGALLGFLLFNFSPASVFLGDSGSLTVGFILGCCAVIWSQKAATFLGMFAPVMAFSVPLLDLVLAIVRRFLSFRPIFSGDRGHIHHRLLERGLTPRGVALILYAVGAVGACLSLLQSTISSALLPVTLRFCALVWAGVRWLRYAEFGIAADSFRVKTFRAVVNVRTAMHVYEESVRSAQTPDECWRALTELSSELGFGETTLTLKDRTYHGCNKDIDGQRWALKVRLSAFESVEFVSDTDTRPRPVDIGLMSELLSSTLCPKLSGFKTEVRELRESARPVELAEMNLRPS